MAGTVLVTGATGFVGRPLVRHLASAGWSVVAGAREAERLAWPAGVAGRAIADLAHPIDWAPLLEGVTHIVHLAGLAHATADVPAARYVAINAGGAARLAAAARTAGIRRFVLMSSVRAQSGPVSEKIVSERDEPRPTDAYGRSKLAAEQAVAEALAGSATENVALRPVLVYGPGVKGNMRALFELAKLPLPLPVGGLRGRRSLVSVANLVHAVAHALVERRCSGGTFLVADPEPQTVPEIVAALRAGLGRGPRLFAVPSAHMGALARLAGVTEAWKRLTGDLVVDTSALRDTGWGPVESTRDALADAMRRDEAVGPAAAPQKHGIVRHPGLE